MNLNFFYCLQCCCVTNISQMVIFELYKVEANITDTICFFSNYIAKKYMDLNLIFFYVKPYSLTGPQQPVAHYFTWLSLEV